MIRKWLRVGAGVVLVLIVAGLVAWFARFEIIRSREGLPAFTDAAGETLSETVSMRDGVGLATTIYQPKGDGPWPTVLIRNPYQGFDLMVGSWCGLLVRYGYACVYQDVRGQGKSDGEWNPLVSERDDGLDTLAWLTSQSFQNRNIAMMGPSYLAAVQWAVAGELPPEVKTFVPAVFTTRTYDTLYQSGMFRHETFTAWSALMPRRGMNRGAGESYQNAIHHRPHNEVDEQFFGGKLQWYQDWIGSPSPGDPYWKQELSELFEGNPGRTQVPILMIGGWYDVFFGPQLQDWYALGSREKSRFVIGPWTHIGQGGTALPTPNAGGGLTQWKVVLDWFGHHLKGEPLENKPGVATYSIGDNKWIERPEWPPQSTPLRLYFDGSSNPHTCDGAGLSTEPPGTPHKFEYAYDPSDPVPTLGGSGMLAFILPGFEGAPPANVWQGDLCAREDILSFTTDAFEEPLHIAGEIKVVLSVASDAEDTAFTAKIVEVMADGRAVNIRAGIATLAYRGGSDRPVPYTPGGRVDLDVEIWPIEWNVAAGSRLRVEVSSSDFPKFHAHPNRAGVWSAQRDAIVAHQTLFTGLGAQSFVELPRVAP